jgi:hypothetical protein
MYFDSLWSDVVWFELATQRFAQDLAGRLGASRVAWVEPSGTGWAVGAELGPETRDLPCLLQEAATWLGECGLPGVAFELDGRIYPLRPVENGAETMAA